MEQTYDLWLSQICGTARTESRYRQDISRFENWALSNHNLKVSDIPKRWREAKYSDKQSEMERFLDGLKDVVSDYFVYLKKYGLTPLSVNRTMATLMSFLHYFDIPFKPIRIRRPFVEYHNRDITKDEIRTIVKNSGVRNRAIYLMLYETGMRPSTLVNLRWKHIKKDFLARKVPMKIELTSDILKCGVSERFVFIGQDGYNALSLYIRRRGVPSDDEELVFVTEKPFGKAIGITSMSQAFNVIVQKLKLAEPRGESKDGKKNRPKDLRLYNLRKAFSKYMAINIDRTLVEYWLGHNSTATHYVSSDIEHHREQYAKGYPSIQLEPSQIPTELIEALKEQHKKELEAVKTECQAKAAKETDDLRKQVGELQKQMQSIIGHLSQDITQSIDDALKESNKKKDSS
jgi:integrase